MAANIRHKIICALDTSDLGEARDITERCAPHVGAFKVGHALVLPHGLGVLEKLREKGAERVFLDLKFHDIPTVVALAVREAARYGVWMLTLHMSGGPAMISAAVEQASAFDVRRPLLIGVSVLTSLDEATLRGTLGVARSLDAHMGELSRMGVECGIDGVVCSVAEIGTVREAIGHGIVVTPGIRSGGGGADDHRRSGSGAEALQSGADYIVVGRALTSASDPREALALLGL